MTRARSINAGISISRGPPAVLLNPGAGAFRSDPGLERRVLRTVGSRAVVCVTRTPAELAEAASSVLDGAPRAVVLAGGDGTYQAGVTALSRAAAARNVALPPLVFLRAGTVCTVARNWGSPRGVLRALERVVDRPEALSVVARPTLAVHDGREERLGFIFGTGLVARFFVLYERHGAGGTATAFALALGAFAESFVDGPLAREVLTPMTCTVTIRGEPLPGSAYSLVLSSVVKDLGIGMKVTHRGGDDFDRPHLVASSLPPRRLGPQWPRVALGLPLRGGFDDLVNDFAVEWPAEGGPYVLDGDTFTSKRVTVRAGPVIQVAT
jgi:diacylglycerol kinase (ATP)